MAGCPGYCFRKSSVKAMEALESIGLLSSQAGEGVVGSQDEVWERGVEMCRLTDSLGVLIKTLFSPSCTLL